MRIASMEHELDPFDPFDRAAFLAVMYRWLDSLAAPGHVVGPPPLCIDGDAYHHRTRARRRRR